jgi:hypothetical protein
MARHDISAVFATGPSKSGASTFLKLLDELIFKQHSGGRTSRTTLEGIINWVAVQRTELGEHVRQCQKAYQEHGTPFPDDVTLDAFDTWVRFESDKLRSLQTLFVSRLPLTPNQISVLSGFRFASVFYMEPDEKLSHRHKDDHGWHTEKKHVARSVSVLRDGGIVLNIPRRLPLINRLEVALQYLGGLDNTPIPVPLIDHGLARLARREDPIHTTIKRIEMSSV